MPEGIYIYIFIYIYIKYNIFIYLINISKEIFARKKQYFFILQLNLELYLNYIFIINL